MDIDRVFFYVCFSSMTQKMVIKTKSVEYMPLFLSLASLVNGICWTAYALIRFDLYITVSYCIQHACFILYIYSTTY